VAEAFGGGAGALAWRRSVVVFVPSLGDGRWRQWQRRSVEAVAKAVGGGGSAGVPRPSLGAPEQWAVDLLLERPSTMTPPP
jgi:hypothetical protein